MRRRMLLLSSPGGQLLLRDDFGVMLGLRHVRSQIGQTAKTLTAPHTLEYLTRLLLAFAQPNILTPHQFTRGGNFCRRTTSGFAFAPTITESEFFVADFFGGRRMFGLFDVCAQVGHGGERFAAPNTSEYVFVCISA